MSDNKPDYVFNIAEQHLKTDEERRYFAQDVAMLAAASAMDKAMAAAEVSRAELARRIGRTAGFVSQVLSGSRNMTLRTLADFAYALGLQVREIELVPVGEIRVSYDVVDSFLDRGPQTVAVGEGVAAAGRDLDLVGEPEQSARAWAA